MTKKYSPMMEHYLSIKEKYKDSILLFRLGDFYEMFFEDAIKASKILGLTLTGRDCGVDKRAEMCGVPYHAVYNYIKKLIEEGCKVAICEQLNTPEEAGKNIVDRDVVRVITPGTLIDDIMLDEKSVNYILSIHINLNSFAIAYCDISSGEFNCREYDDLSFLEDCILNIGASEIIANEETVDILVSLKSFVSGRFPHPQKYNKIAFEEKEAEKTIKKQLKITYLESIGLYDKKNAIIAAGALLNYLKETQKRELVHINRIKYISDNANMILDNVARRNLEITETIRDKRKKGTLLWLLNETVTSMGARRIKQIIENPLFDADAINERLDAVEELINHVRIRDNINEYLKNIRDIERLAGKISYGNLTPRDCVSICESLSILPGLKKVLVNCKSTMLKNIGTKMPLLTEIYTLLDNAIIDNPPALTKDGGYIKEKFNKDLDEYRLAQTNSKELITKLESAEKTTTGIKNLKVGYNKVYGYYIEVTSSYKGLVPIDRYIRKQTIVNAERYITEELKELEQKILQADELSLKLENEIFNMIKSKLLEIITDLQIIADNVTLCDILLSFSKISARYEYVRPKINNDIKCINIEDGYHPVLKALMQQDFISNDLYIDNDKSRILVITGPNMAGKSTYMRQTAIITIMAHIGCFVSARYAEISLTDRIFTRIGASDDLGLGQSTFMTEMIEVSNLLNNMTDKSLLILDEIGRGTSTYDGLSIAWSILEYLSKRTKTKTLFSTHYHEIAELEGMIDGLKNYNILVKEVENSIQFLYKITRGSANKSFGIKVAALAGLPKIILERAEMIMKKLEESDINKDTNSLMIDNIYEGSNTKQLNFIDEQSAQNKIKNDLYNMIKDTKIENCTPIQALTILNNLKELIN